MTRFAIATLAVFLCAAAILLAQSASAGQTGSNAAVSPSLWNGFKRYHATCNHCHGPAGVGSTFGPSLVETPLPYAPFRRVVLDGSRSGNSVMMGFAGDPNVVAHIADIHAYLQARAEGRLGRGRPKRPD